MADNVYFWCIKNRREFNWQFFFSQPYSQINTSIQNFHLACLSFYREKKHWFTQSMGFIYFEMPWIDMFVNKAWNITNGKDRMIWSKMYAKLHNSLKWRKINNVDPATIVYSFFFFMCVCCPSLVLITLVITTAIIRTSHTAVATLCPDSTMWAPGFNCSHRRHRPETCVSKVIRGAVELIR